MNRRVERPHPVYPVRNPHHPEKWYSVQESRFKTIMKEEME